MFSIKKNFLTNLTNYELVNIIVTYLARLYICYLACCIILLKYISTYYITLK